MEFSSALSPEFMRHVLEKTFDGVLTFDLDFRYTSWNAAMERLTGLPRDQLIGQCAFDVFPFLIDTGEDQIIREAVCGRETISPARPFYIAATARYGYFEGHYGPLRSSDGTIVGGYGVIRDVEEPYLVDSLQSVAQDALNRVVRVDVVGPQVVWSSESERLMQLQSIIQALCQAVTLHEVGEAILKESMRIFRASRGVITRVPENGGETAEVLVLGNASAESQSKWCSLSLNAPLPTCAAIRSRQPVYHSTRQELLQAYPASERWIVDSNLEAFVALPLIVESRVVGALGLGFAEPRAFATEAKSFLIMVAGHCAQAFERSHAYEREKKARQAAEAANGEKGHFIANFSHEIRTPLCALINYAEFLANPNQSEDRRRTYVDGVRRNGEALVRLIDDILDLSRIESGRLTFKRERVDVAALVDEVIGVFQERVASKGVTLSLQIEPGTPSVVEIDPVRLRQILLNLIGNAVKFTESGSVAVRVRSVASLGGTSHLQFEVEDTGPGISMADQPRVFEAFFQGDGTLTRTHSGSGLGLAISRRLANAMGGDVQLLRSTPGVGSLFVLEVRGDAVNSGASEGEDPNAVSDSEEKRLVDGDSLRGRHILVVEDSADIQDIIARILEESGAQVTLSDNGREGVRTWVESEEAFDLILMDLQMPVLDGYSAYAALRERGCQVPIVALTAQALEEDTVRVRHTGFDGHLTKPLERTHLVRALKDLLIEAR